MLGAKPETQLKDTPVNADNQPAKEGNSATTAAGSKQPAQSSWWNIFGSDPATEARAQAEAEARARAQADEKVRAEAEAKVQAEAIARAKALAIAAAKAEAEAKEKAEADARAKLEQEANEKAAIDAKNAKEAQTLAEAAMNAEKTAIQAVEDAIKAQQVAVAKAAEAKLKAEQTQQNALKLQAIAQASLASATELKAKHETLLKAKQTSESGGLLSFLWSYGSNSTAAVATAATAEPNEPKVAEQNKKDYVVVDKPAEPELAAGVKTTTTVDSAAKGSVTKDSPPVVSQAKPEAKKQQAGNIAQDNTKATYATKVGKGKKS